jgi:hypothetical protein
VQFAHERQRMLAHRHARAHQVAQFEQSHAEAVIALVNALDQSDEVEFGIQVGVKGAKSATGYEYTCRPLVESKPSDAMQKLIAIALSTTPKAIAA